MSAGKKVFKETDLLNGIPKRQILNFITIITDKSFTKQTYVEFIITG